MDKKDLEFLSSFSDVKLGETGAHSIRHNGKLVEKYCTENIEIVSKLNGSGIEIYVKNNTKNEVVHIPVILTQSGYREEVYNDFYIGENCKVTIIAGCGINNCGCDDSQHNGIHSFYIGKNSKVVYTEKHIGNEQSKGKNILNPQTIVNMAQNSRMEMNTIQIKGVDIAKRSTHAKLEDGAVLIIKEKLFTDNQQNAETNFEVELNGTDANCQIVSRSIATESSKQRFCSKVIGNAKCFAHIECDAILKDKATVVSIPEIVANNVDARLIHEAAIGKISGMQIVKLMTLGLSEAEAEQTIIQGFLNN